MSRIASHPVELPPGVEARTENNHILIKGCLGTLTQKLPKDVKVSLEEKSIKFAAIDGHSNAKAMSGTLRSLVSNMVSGVSKGFERKLILVGVGYRASVEGSMLRLQLGFSHQITYSLPDNIEAECPTQTEILIKGINKQVVGQVAADIRSYRKPEPYKGKGIRYSNENVVIKETKKK